MDGEEIRITISRDTRLALCVALTLAVRHEQFEAMGPRKPPHLEFFYRCTLKRARLWLRLAQDLQLGTIESELKKLIATCEVRV